MKSSTNPATSNSNSIPGATGQLLAPEVEIARGIDSLNAKKAKLKAEMKERLTQPVWKALVEAEDELSDLKSRLRSVEATKAGAKRAFLKNSPGGTSEMFERLWPSIYEDMLRASLRETTGHSQMHSRYKHF